MSFPPDQCVIAGCSTRIPAEYEFTSSDPDIADFVRQDPDSTNLRKPLLDEDDKVVTDAASGLLCAFNAGTTTVNIRAGGFSYSTSVRVLGGSVQRPCGTRPLRADRFQRQPSSAPPAPPPPAPAANPPVSFAPPPPPPVVAPPLVKAKLRPATSLPPLSPFVPVPQPLQVSLLATPPPPPATPGRPLPPGGVGARVYQREEEEDPAIEESQAFSRYEPDAGGGTVPPYTLALVVLLALAGATVRGRPTRRPAAELERNRS